MKHRLIILLILLVVGFTSIYLLPKSFALQSSALPGGLRSEGRTYELPGLVDLWRGGPARKASEQEITILAADTKFLKKNYLRRNTSIAPRQVAEPATELERMMANTDYEEVEVSVVTSGSDMGNSIHRPERCLVAQGFNITGDRKVMLKLNGRDLPVKRLITNKHIKDEKSGRFMVFRNLTYYFFVGHDSVTNDHYERTLLDTKDRLLEGYDQEWAYATVGMMIDSHWADNHDAQAAGSDKVPRILTRSLDVNKEDSKGFTEADYVIQEFVIGLAKEVIDRKMIKAWRAAPVKS